MFVGAGEYYLFILTLGLVVAAFVFWFRKPQKNLATKKGEKQIDPAPEPEPRPAPEPDPWLLTDYAALERRALSELRCKACCGNPRRVLLPHRYLDETSTRSPEDAVGVFIRRLSERAVDQAFCSVQEVRERLYRVNEVITRETTEVQSRKDAGRTSGNKAALSVLQDLQALKKLAKQANSHSSRFFDQVELFGERYFGVLGKTVFSYLAQRAAIVDAEVLLHRHPDMQDIDQEIMTAYKEAGQLLARFKEVWVSLEETVFENTRAFFSRLSTASSSPPELVAACARAEQAAEEIIKELSTVEKT